MTCDTCGVRLERDHALALHATRSMSVAGEVLAGWPDLELALHLCDGCADAAGELLQGVVAVLARGVAPRLEAVQ